MATPSNLIALMASLAMCGPALATFDEFADERSPTHFELRARGMHLQIKGELELELHDLEGQGGPGFDSATDTRTLGTRSPFVEVDTFWIAPRLTMPFGLAVNAILEFRPRGAGITAVWLDLRERWPERVEHHVEVGLHTPMVKVDRLTERYPLVASAFWRQPEMHAAYELAWMPWAGFRLEAGLSIALMRPLGFAPVQDAESQPGTIRVLAYGPARPFSGNAPIVGSKIHVEAGGLFVTAFGFAGQMASEGGTDELRSALPHYSELGPRASGHDAQLADRQALWGGGRLGLSRGGFESYVEIIASREGRLARWGGYGQVAYQLRLRDAATQLFHTFIPVLRVEAYRILGSTRPGPSGAALRSPSPSQAVTWDFDVLTAGVVVVIYRNVLRVRAEVAQVEERNGVPAQGLADVPLANDELLFQLEIRF